MVVRLRTPAVRPSGPKSLAFVQVQRICSRVVSDEPWNQRPRFSAKRPFGNPPKIPEKIQRVKPKLVCEVAFAEWTEDEQKRQTTFLSLREDKDPKEVVREV
jgi:ATP-dependent DNA ligase